MLTKFLAVIWRHLPVPLRRRISRFSQKRFTVTTAALIFDREGRILLLEHVFRADNGWGVPGGFLTKREQPEDGLRRELREEIGIEIDDLHLLFVRTLVRPGQVEIYFRARAIGTPRPCSFEIKTAAWFQVDDLPRNLSKDQRRLIARALSLIETDRG